MLIAQELFLLLTTAEGKAESFGTYSGYGLSAAVVTDLILAGRIELSQDKDPKVSVVSTDPTGDPVLDPALARLEEKPGKKLSSVIQDGKLDPTENVVRSLNEAGVIRVEPKRMLGLIPERRPTLDPGPEQQVRGRLQAVLAGGPAGIADVSLLSILQGLGVAASILEVERGGMSKRELKERIAQVSADTAVGSAVARSVEMMNTIILTTAIIPAITTSTQ